MDTGRELLYLAALLHDIGKFYQRADTGSVADSKYLKPEVAGLCDTLLPKYKGECSHKHCLWTAQFIEDYAPVFRKLTTGQSSDLTDKDNLTTLSAGHHLPFEQQTELGRLLKKADSLSSGMDRASDEARKDDQDEAGWDSFKRKRMTSILQDVRNNDVGERFHLPLSRILLDKSYFPDKKDEAPDYVSLWDDFKREFNLIQADSYHSFTETLLSLLFKYTTTIPASTINFPDVSLYDHLKTTAAIAVCLYDCEREHRDERKPPFLLIGGDLSGIQGYIYQIISKYAAKNLKGRSFYLRILSDAIVRYLLKELGLFRANVIYNSGGSFYILAPNTTDVKRDLDKAVVEIEEKMFKSHGISLFAAIDWVEVSEDRLMHRNGENLQKAWDELFRKRDTKKQARFASLLLKDYDGFFEPSEGKRLRDSITGEEFTENELSHAKELDEEERKELRLREITYQQIQLGKALRNSRLMVVSEIEIPSWGNKTLINPASLGFYYYLLEAEDKKDINKVLEPLEALGDKVSIVFFNSFNEGNKVTLRNNIYSMVFYGGNQYKDMKKFDEMAEGDSLSRLGVLRMDVDNLGSLFQSGIRKDLSTLSRYAALSRSLDYFFSGYLNTIQQDVEKENMFIVYSGGDDLFIVGRWDKTILMAERIRADFKEYTCGNPAFSISGGIAIIGGKFPIMKGAEESDKEEKNAKNHVCAGQEKNSVSFLGTPLNWDKEFPAVKALKDEIRSLVDDKKSLPKSFISKVASHAMNAKIVKHRITVAKTFWMLTYDLSRMKGAAKASECKKLIDNCIREVCGKAKTLNGNAIETDYHPLELWMMAARWAELELRTNN